MKSSAVILVLLVIMGLCHPVMGQKESGYADVNGLKLYYEVHDSGKPLVLLHGSYMSIPLNWSHMLPLLAKDRKVIVAEMQGHGRTRDIPRQISFEGMADDVSGLTSVLRWPGSWDWPICWGKIPISKP